MIKVYDKSLGDLLDANEDVSDTPPELKHKANTLNTSIEIFTIDSIDTIRMEVGLTFAIKIQWIDPRLTYSNVLNEPFEDPKTVKILGRFI